MDRGLIEQRHPMLGAVLGHWTGADGRSAALTADRLGGLADWVVWIRPDAGEGLLLADSGAAVRRLFGEGLDGRPAGALSTVEADVGAEAVAAMESRRPLLMEDGPPERRIVRLHLPITEPDGSVGGVLCAVAEVPIG